MARRGGKKSGKAGASTSGVDWGKVTTIALAVAAVSGAVVAVSGGIPKLISAFTGGGAGNESVASGNPAARSSGPALAKAVPAGGAGEPQVRGPRVITHRDGSEELVCDPGQNLVNRRSCIWPTRVVAPPCPPGLTRVRAGRCEEPPAVSIPDCPPGWTRDGNGVCQDPERPIETKQCPDNSVIPVTQECPRIEVRYPGPFIVFFDWDKDEITPAAAAILDNAAAGYRQVGSASVAVAGHADSSGSSAYNVGLSQRRADAVRDYLAGRGVPDAAITPQAFGESHPLVDTADGVREPQNRRVELTFGPAAGW